MRVRGDTLLAAAFAAPMAFLYLTGLGGAVLKGFGGWSNLDVLVLLAMFARVGVIMSVKRLRDGNPVVAMDVLSLEMLALPVLAFVGLALGDRWLIPLGSQVFVVWPTALLLASPVFAIYEICKLMTRGSALSSVIPTGAMLFLALQLLLSANPYIASNPSFPSLISSVTAGGGATGLEAAEVVSAAVFLYVTMVAYAAAGGKGAVASLNPPLALAVACTAISIVLTAWALQFGRAEGVVMLVPASALVAMTWILSHVH